MGSIRSKIINTLLIVDIGIVLFCYLAGQRDWFINSQIAYFSSLVVVMASMYSYAQMVKTGVKNGAVTTSTNELLDKIEDPHGVFDEDDKAQVQDDAQDQDDKEQEKISTIEAMKKNKAYVSFYRIGAYAILVLGFLYLQNLKIFHMPSYMFGLILPPILIAIMLFLEFKNIKG